MLTFQNTLSVPSSYLPAYEDGTNRVFRNFGIQNSDAGELPRRKHTIFKTRRKFEIKNCLKLFSNLMISSSIHCTHVLSQTVNRSVKKEKERDVGKFTLTLFCYVVSDYCAIIFIFTVSFHFVSFYHIYKKKHGFVGGFIITYLKHCCENYV